MKLLGTLYLQFSARSKGGEVKPAVQLERSEAERLEGGDKVSVRNRKAFTGVWEVQLRVLAVGVECDTSTSLDYSVCVG